jgi:CubicO group peptidase (beta-lactamase class C family)
MQSLQSELQRIAARDPGFRMNVAVGRRGHGEHHISILEGRAEQSGPSKRVWPLLCAGKPLLALAYARAHEEGLVSWDDRVADYAPEFGAGGKEAVTVAELFTHTSGLQAARGPFSFQAPPFEIWRAACASEKVTEQRGALWYNSAWAWTVLRRALERRLGRSADQFVASEVLGPLGLDIALGAIGKADEWDAAADTMATAPAMLALYRHLGDIVATRTSGVVSAATLSRMLATRSPPGRGAFRGVSYSIGFEHNGLYLPRGRIVEAFGHGGTLNNHFIAGGFADPRTRLAVFLAGNVPRAASTATTLRTWRAIVTAVAECVGDDG